MYGVAFLAYFLAFRILMAEGDSCSFTVVLVFAVAFRLIALSGDPLFEDDFHRYMWDGKVWADGINPYLYPPDSLFLEHLQDENWKSVGFKSIPTIYPPFAQLVFRVSYAIAPNSLFVLKLILLLFDVGVILVLSRALRLLNRPATWTLIYGWNPLVIKEFANSAHVDVVAIFFVACFLTLCLGRRNAAGALALGVAVLSKVFPVLLLPALTRKFKAWHFSIVAVVVVGGYIPFWDV